MAGAPRAPAPAPLTVRPASGPTVLALSTGARPLPDDEAATRTADAVDAVVAAGAERLYLKLDSTVRGSVAGQVDGALAAWSRHHPQVRAVVLPRLPGPPAHGGRRRGPGRRRAPRPLPRRRGPGDAADGRRPDPAAARGGAAHPRRPRRPARCRLRSSTPGDADLDRLAGLIDAAGPELVVVGSGGLSAALGRTWSAPGGGRPGPGVRGQALIAVSSLHPTSAGRSRCSAPPRPLPSRRADHRCRDPRSRCRRRGARRTGGRGARRRPVRRARRRRRRRGRRRAGRPRRGPCGDRRRPRPGAAPRAS